VLHREGRTAGSNRGPHHRRGARLGGAWSLVSRWCRHRLSGLPQHRREVPGGPRLLRPWTTSALAHSAMVDLAAGRSARSPGSRWSWRAPAGPSSADLRSVIRLPRERGVTVPRVALPRWLPTRSSSAASESVPGPPSAGRRPLVDGSRRSELLTDLHRSPTYRGHQPPVVPTAPAAWSRISAGERGACVCGDRAVLRLQVRLQRYAALVAVCVSAQPALESRSCARTPARTPTSGTTMLSQEVPPVPRRCTDLLRLVGGGLPAEGKRTSRWHRLHRRPAPSSRWPRRSPSVWSAEASPGHGGASGTSGVR